jgi:hypothetical protein
MRRKAIHERWQKGDIRKWSTSDLSSQVIRIVHSYRHSGDTSSSRSCPTFCPKLTQRHTKIDSSCKWNHTQILPVWRGRLATLDPSKERLSLLPSSLAVGKLSLIFFLIQPQYPNPKKRKNMQRNGTFDKRNRPAHSTNGYGGTHKRES